MYVSASVTPGSPSLAADALRAPLAGGHLLARGEEQAELLGRVPCPPLALRAGLAVEEALGDAVAHLEVDQLALALPLGVARHSRVVVWRLFLSGRRLEITKPGSLFLRSLYGPLLSDLLSLVIIKMTFEVVKIHHSSTS